MLVRNYRTKTTSHVEKERFIGGQTVELTLSDSECSSLAGTGRGLYRRGFIGGAVLPENSLAADLCLSVITR
jgi:hypothetical protein